jgi:hypothetical protein
VEHIQIKTKDLSTISGAWEGTGDLLGTTVEYELIPQANPVPACDYDNPPAVCSDIGGCLPAVEPYAEPLVYEISGWVSEPLTISVPLIGTYSGFGSSSVYRGQTFTTPPERSLANKLSVFVGPSPDGGEFRVLLTGTEFVDGVFHPTTVLFESETLYVPPSTGPLPDTFEIELPNIPLEANQQYAWILDHFVVATGDVVGMDTGLGAQPYDGGFGFAFVNGPFLPPGTREDHFAIGMMIYDDGYILDFAFELQLTL